MGGKLSRCLPGRPAGAWEVSPGGAEHPEPAHLKVSTDNNYQVEVKVVYRVNGAVQRQLYTVTMYLFFPAELESVHIAFYDNLWQVVRLHTPKVALAALAAPDGLPAGLPRVPAVLARLQSAAKAGGAQALDGALDAFLQGLRLHACMFRSAARRGCKQVVRQASAAAAMQSDEAREAAAAGALDLVEDLCLAILAYQQVCAPCEGPSLPGDAREAWRLAHEFMLWEAERALLKMLRDLNRIATQQAAAGSDGQRGSHAPDGAGRSDAGDLPGGPVADSRETHAGSSSAARQAGAAGAFQARAGVGGPMQWRTDSQAAAAEQGAADPGAQQVALARGFSRPASSACSPQEPDSMDQAAGAGAEQDAQLQAEPAACLCPLHGGTADVDSCVVCTRSDPGDHQAIDIPILEEPPEPASPPRSLSTPLRTPRATDSWGAPSPAAAADASARSDLAAPAPGGLAQPASASHLGSLLHRVRTAQQLQAQALSAPPSRLPTSDELPSPASTPAASPPGSRPPGLPTLVLPPPAPSAGDASAPLSSPDSFSEAHSVVMDAIAGLQAERAARGYSDSVLDPADPRCNEHYTNRIKVLKRNARAAVSLYHQVHPAPTLLFDVVGVLFAGVAMIVALLTVWAAQRIINDQWSIFYLTIIVIGYMIKDRIKEWGKRYLVPVASKLGAWFPDRVVRVADLHARTMGRSREQVKVVSDDKVDSKILSARHRDKGYVPSRRAATRPERVLVYTKKMQVHWDRLDAGLRGVDGLDDVMRFDLHQFCRRMQPPRENHYMLQPSKGGAADVVKVKCARVYHVNMVLSIRTALPGAAHAEDTSMQLQRARIIVDHNGIKRLEGGASLPLLRTARSVPFALSIALPTKVTGLVRRGVASSTGGAAAEPTTAQADGLQLWPPATDTRLAVHTPRPQGSLLQLPPG